MEKIDINKYTYRVQWSEEDQTHIARCLEFPSLSADGKTPEKALKEIKVVVKESVDWMIEDGEVLPQPFGLKEYSGKVVLRMPEQVHRSLAIEAAEQGTSLNQYALSKIAK